MFSHSFELINNLRLALFTPSVQVLMYLISSQLFSTLHLCLKTLLCVAFPCLPFFLAATFTLCGHFLTVHCSSECSTLLPSFCQQLAQMCNTGTGCSSLRICAKCGDLSIHAPFWYGLHQYISNFPYFIFASLSLASTCIPCTTIVS